MDRFEIERIHMESLKPVTPSWAKAEGMEVSFSEKILWKVKNWLF